MKQTQPLTLTIIAAIALAMATAPAAYSQVRTWGDSAADDNWNTAANWTTVDVPDTPAEGAAFSSTGVGTVNLNIPGTTTIGTLTASSYTGTYNLDLNGNTLLLSSGAVVDKVLVGNANVAGTFNITNGTFTTQGGIWRVGQAGSGTLTISAGIGTPANHATTMFIGWGSSAVSATGIVAITGTGQFRADITDDTNRLYLGYGTSSGNAIGSLTLGENLTSAYIQNHTLRLGQSTAGTYNGTVDGKLISSTATTLGDAAAPFVQMFVGVSAATAGAGTTTGTLDLSAAPSIAGVIRGTTERALTVGVGRNATGTISLPTGSLIVSNASNDNYAMQIGDSTGDGGSGTVTLTGTQLTLKNSYTTASSRRALQIGDSGHLINNIADNSSGPTIDVVDSAAIAFDIAAFSLGGVGMTLNFDDPNFTPTPAAPYWGFRWRGNFVDPLTNYVNEPGSAFTSGDGRIAVNIVGGSNLQWSDFNIGTYSDGGITYTYIGFTDWEAPLMVVPEPSTIFLLLVGGGLLYRRWGRNAK